MTTTSSAPPTPQGPSKCRTCGAPVGSAVGGNSASGGGPYCSQCGELLVVQRISFRNLVDTMLGHFFSLDFRFMRTVVDLLRSPGSMAARYVEGDRRRYTNPFKFSLIAGGIVVLVIHLISKMSPAQAATRPAMQAAATMPHAERVIKEASQLMVQWTNDYVHLIYFLALPLLAVMMRVCFPGPTMPAAPAEQRPPMQRNVLEWLVLCLYTHGQIYLIQALCIVFTVALADVFKAAAIGFLIINQASPWVVFTWGAIGFVGRRPVLTGVKAFFMYLLFTVLLASVQLGIAAAVVLSRERAAEHAPAAATQPVSAVVPGSVAAAA